MVMNWCEKHDHFKRDCPWCEIEELENENQRLRAALEEKEREIRNLREAAIALHQTLNTYWLGYYHKSDVIAAQSNLCDVLSTTPEPKGDGNDERN